MEELTISAGTTNAAIIAVTETWLDNTISDNEVCIPGYGIQRKDRNREGGGVCIFIRNNINFNRRCDIDKDDLAFLAIDIMLPKSKPILLGVGYRPPRDNMFYAKLEEVLSSCTNLFRQECYILGDFNTDILAEKSVLKKDFENFLRIFDLKQIITEPTRVTDTSETAIDLICTSDVANVSQSGVLPWKLSDHNVIFCTRKLKKCPFVIDVKAWLASRCLLLNEAKTEAILFAAPNNRIPQPPPLCIDVCGCNIIASSNIRDLGVQLDSTMSMAAHVSRTCRTAYAQLRSISRIRSSLPISARKTLVHALVTSKLDFGNATLCGITGTLLHRLEMVQRAAARVVLGLRRRDHHSMTAALQRLHWLPVAYRIRFKLLTLMHAAIHANTPRYLADRVSAYNPSRSLRSADLSLLVVPRVNSERFGRRAFSVAGPSLWNYLPLVLRTQKDDERFRRDLKTHLYKQAFM